MAVQGDADGTVGRMEDGEGRLPGKGPGEPGDPEDNAPTIDGPQKADPESDPGRFNEWRKRSATGAVMTGIALGLKEALVLPDDRPALVVEAPGEPDEPDRPIALHFDPDDPAATVAIVRQRREDTEDDQRPTGP